MSAICAFAVRHPRRVLAAWLVAVVTLGVVGAKVEQRLHLTKPNVPGSASALAQSRTLRLFGEESTLVAMLDGPRAQLERRGPSIVRALDRIPHVSAVSPWMPSAPSALHPRPQNALVLLNVAEPYERVGKVTVPLVRTALARTSGGSVGHHLTGYPDIAAAVERETFAALKQAEMIAALLLGVLLLFVFRGLVAASVPLFLGISSVAAARGLLVILNGAVLPLDAAALSLATMFGLALGVDYSLLLVSRFREQLAAGEQPRDAALGASATAGRTVLVAGAALAAAMAAAYFIAPNEVLSSGSVGGLTAVGASLLGTIVALPALLTLIGPRIDRWQLSRREPGEGLAALAWSMIRRPLVCSGLTIVVLAALATQALSIRLGPPNESSLPRTSPEVHDLAAIGTQLGGGWVTPYEVVIRARRGLVTDPRTMSAMAAWQARLEHDPGIAAVIGPREVYGGEGPASTSEPYATEAQISLELLRDAPPEQLGAVKLAANVFHGGTALRMLVIERTRAAATLAHDPASRPGDPLRVRLEHQGAALEAHTGTSIAVGGPAAVLQDFTSSSEHVLPRLTVVLSLVTFFALLLMMRSVAVALVSVVLNVLTVGATLGALVLLFQNAGGPFATGAGQLDGVIAPAVLSVAFGLAIDYEVFLLSRIREAYRRCGDVDESIRFALRRTAPVIAGAALIMCGVFVAFASTSLANLREYGVGLTVAVVIDATIVRLVLLPSAIRLLGHRAWSVPRVGRLLDRSPVESS